MDPADARALLDPLVGRYERPAFIDDDPISVVWAFDDPADREVIGLFAAVLAWGRRSVILSKLADLVDRMDARPHRFVRDFALTRADRLDGFKHRTFSSADAVALTRSVQAALEEHGSLGALFAGGLDEGSDIGPAIQTFSDTLLTIVPDAGMRSKHLARPSTGSACKRLAMYARWMTRPGPVDLGQWTGVRPDQLVIPLDVHTGTQARRLGLLERRYDDWRAVQELTDVCRQLAPDDPARYDFALFGLGAYGGGDIE
ncbi:TIGR02757 family protein [Rubrivirga sp.]|uniref:TIGR02757 family protein n=1 Tax=Rubrivirga sp. TaxID=1885344 RepID=UPI003B51F2A0